MAGGGDIKQMGRMGGKAILYFEIVTTLALFLGLAAVNLVQPGRECRSSGRRRKPRWRRLPRRLLPCWNTSFRRA